MISDAEPSLIKRDIPTEFLHRMSGLLGEDYQAFLQCLQEPATVGLRVNTLKIRPGDLINRLLPGLKPVPWCPAGFYTSGLFDPPGYPSPGKHPYHIAGLYYLQEPSAMAAAELLAPRPGETVLDISAAPGGKSTHMAALMKNTGLLVANEIHPRRVWDLAENLERCGVTNAVVTNESPGRLADRFGEYFDRVLLDSPCSGEGMFRKSESARKEWHTALSKSCAVRQNVILEQAARLVKPGGQLAYTTCTFSPLENEAVIVKFLESHPEFDINSISLTPGLQPARPDWIGLSPDHKLKYAVRLWPHQAGGEGHFIAILVKGQSSALPSFKPRSLPRRTAKTISGRINPDYASLIDFTGTYLQMEFDQGNVYRSGSYLYYHSGEPPCLDGLNVIHPGWWLGSLHKNRFIPSHALAMAVDAEKVQRSVRFQLGDPGLSVYLTGHTFNSPGDDGWVLITLDGYPLGWGKRVNQVIKNYYPHGLRQYK